MYCQISHNEVYGKRAVVFSFPWNKYFIVFVHKTNREIPY